MFWVCVLRVGINIISTQNKKLSMRHFTIMVNPNKSSLSNQIPKIKVAEFSPATTFRPPSVCEVNNSNANFSPKKVPTYSQLGKYYYGCNSGCVSFLSSVRREANPDPNASAVGCLQRICLWALKAHVRRPPSWWPHGTAFQQFRCLIIHITRKGFGVRHHLLKYGCSIA